MTSYAGPGLAPPANELPALSESNLLREQLRRARLLIAIIAIAAVALGGGWYWERGEAERRVDSATRAEVQQVLAAWGQLQEAVGEQDVTDADLKAAGILPDGPGIRSGLRFYRSPLTVTGVNYTTTRIRQEAGGVVLVEAFSNYQYDGTQQNGGAYYFTFLGDHGALRLAAQRGDLRDGL